MFVALILAYFLIMMAVTVAADNAAVPFVMGAALILILLVVGEAKGGDPLGLGETTGPRGPYSPGPGTPLPPLREPCHRLRESVGVRPVR